MRTALAAANAGTATGGDYTTILDAYNAGEISAITQPQYASAITLALQYNSGANVNYLTGKSSPLTTALVAAKNRSATTADWSVIIAAVNAGTIDATTDPQYAAIIEQSRTIANARATSLSSSPSVTSAYQHSLTGTPAFAAGTASTPPGWILLGEEGPEWVHQSGGARVLPFGQFPPELASGANDNALAIVRAQPGAGIDTHLPPGITKADLGMRSFAHGTIPPPPVIPIITGTSGGGAGDAAMLKDELQKLRDEIVALRKQTQGGQIQAASDARAGNTHLGDISRNLGPAITTPPRRAVG